MDSLWCTLQDKVNIIGCIAAGGPWRHPRWPPRGPPSWILLKIQICRVIQKLQIVFTGVVQYDRIKHFAAFGSILYGFYWKTRIFIQNWLDLMLLMTSYLVTITTDCRQTLKKCVSRINEQLQITAYDNNKCCWRNCEKPLEGWHPTPLYARGLIESKWNWPRFELHNFNFNLWNLF